MRSYHTSGSPHDGRVKAGSLFHWGGASVMVRLGMMANEGDMDARLWSIVVYKSMFGGRDGTRPVWWKFGRSQDKFYQEFLSRQEPEAKGRSCKKK